MDQRNHRRSWLKIGVWLIALVTILSSGFAGPVPVQAQTGNLTVEIIAGYNLVVDSNVTATSTYAPRVATVIGKFCNTGGADLTNLYGYIGDGTTAGTYPKYDSDTQTTYPYLNGSGEYYYRHVGSAADATRYMGTISTGECLYQYWTIEYPACENVGSAWAEPPCTGDPLWGPDIKPDDDFSLPFTIWGTADGPITTSESWTMTMRNEISAMANKIKPNPDGRWFNTENDTVNVGDTVTTNGILYTLGNVRFGFDNDGNYVPDYNAWLQPISQPDFDPECFRLVDVTGVLTVTRGSGNPDMIIPIDNSLYFTDLPPDNTNVLGKVYYKFLALNGPCSMGLTPYQEAASGFDNEKFNGDYGTGVPTIRSLAPKVILDKTGTTTVTEPGEITYEIPFYNSSTDASAGLTLASSGVYAPLVVQDMVPEGLQYVCGSASVINPTTDFPGAAIWYSKDSGVTWGTETATWAACSTPGTHVDPLTNERIVLRFELNGPLPADDPDDPDPAEGATATFKAYVNTGYIVGGGDPFIENCAEASLDDAGPFAEACTTTMVPGDNSIGDFVWRDENRNGLTDDGATGISGVTVSLYSDRGTIGVLDDEDILVVTQDTSGATEGNYDFTLLPNGNYLVQVDTDDADIPTGYYPTTDTIYAVSLTGGTDYNDADFGFGPSLGFDKQLISGDPAYEGDIVTFNIDLTNNRPGDGNPPGPCRYTAWGTTQSGGTGNKAWINPGNIVPAPDNLYATAPFANAGETIAVTTWNLGSTPAETIQKVEVLVPMVLYPTLAGTLQVQVIRGTTTYDHPYDVTTLGDGTLVIDVTNDNSVGGPSGWAWTDFTGGSTSTSVQLVATKSGNPSGNLDVDAVGYRITTDATCGNLSDTMNPVPLSDTFDGTKLQFLYARPPATSVSGEGTTSGLITWNNVGPIYAGQTKEIIVRFRALQPPDSDADGEPDFTTHQNCASTSGGQFVDGAPVNDADDCVTHNINPAGTIGDYVWADTNGDGIQDATEFGLGGVTVWLYDCGTDNICDNTDDVLVETTSTDTMGRYLFESVQDTNRNYMVRVDVSTLPGGSNAWNNSYDDDADTDSKSGAINIDYDDNNSATDDYLNADFGYQPKNNQRFLFGTVWHDRDDSGDGPPPDAGEEGLAGVTVSACTGSDCATGCTSTTTDAAGQFMFTTLSAGTYYVCVNTGTGPLSTGTWSQTFDTNGLGTPNQATAVLPTTGYTRVDFSYRRTDTIALGDTVYTDWNGDGQQGDGNPANGDEGEGGISGVTVWLYADDGDGVYEPGTDIRLQTTATNASGWYNFNVTPGGDYLVVIDQATIPSGYRQTQDPDETGVCVTCNGYSDEQNLAATNLLQDFGYKPVGAGSIGDFVWRDMDHDGIQDGGSETGIANIGITLYVWNDDGDNVVEPGEQGALIASTTTDADGHYLFTGLPAGKFLVDVDTMDADLPLDGNNMRYVLSTGNDPHAVSLSAGQAYLDADFGFTPGGAIGDRVWQDTNGNGNQDEDEPGINGVLVRLYTWTDSDGNGYYNTGDALVDTGQTDTTAGDGNYLFSSLPADDYVVMVESGIPAGFTQSGDPDWLVPCTGTGLCDGASGVNLGAGQINLSRDFGYQPPGVIGDYVWFDSDGDGVQDANESGIGYVSVKLCSDAACSYVLDTTQTDSDGYYSFGNLSGGTYYVQVDQLTLPAGVVATYDLDGTGTLHITAVTLTAGGSNLTADFGYRYYDPNGYSISGHVFFDAGSTGDGTNDLYATGTDTPYQSIPIYLWRDGQIVGETTTDSTGYFSFGNLPDGGTYTVSVDRSGRLDLMALTATPNNTPEVKSFNTVTISGANVTDQDFGFYAAIDYGDLPDSYNTLVASEGAGHIVGSLYLGGAPSTETDGKPSSDVNLDTDDGITFPAGQSWSAGATINFTVDVAGTNGYLVGWFDWDGDGTFSGDEIVIFGDIAQGSDIPMTVDIPDDATPGDWVYMRFRLYDGETVTSLSPTGLVSNGEVEDYKERAYPTAVTLSNFWSTLGSGSIILHWETATELDNLGFHIERAESTTGPRIRLNADLIPSQSPGSLIGATYEFVDNAVAPNTTYYYWLIAVDTHMHLAVYGPLSQRLDTGTYSVFLPLVDR